MRKDYVEKNTNLIVIYDTVLLYDFVNGAAFIDAQYTVHTYTHIHMHIHNAV